MLFICSYVNKMFMNHMQGTTKEPVNVNAVSTVVDPSQQTPKANVDSDVPKSVGERSQETGNASVKPDTVCNSYVRYVL